MVQIKKTFKLTASAKKRLQDILDSSDMTQAEIGKLTGMTQANISYLFNKKLDNMLYSTLELLAEALEFNKEYILDASCTSRVTSVDHKLWLQCSALIIEFIEKENILLNPNDISSLTLSMHNHIRNNHFPIEEARTYLYGQTDFWIKMRTLRKAPF